VNEGFNSSDISKNSNILGNLKVEIQQYLDRKTYICASIVEGIAAKRNTIWGFLSSIIIIPLSFFYFLRDWTVMTEYIYGCFPLSQKHTFNVICGIIRRTLRNFFHGQFYVVTTLSAYYIATLWMVGVTHYTTLGIISGLFSFIPLLGALFSCFLVIFVSVPVLTLAKFYIILIMYFVGQLTEGYVLYPKFVGRKTGLHPLWILFSFFAGAELNGTIGVLIAIPSAAVIRNLIGFAVSKFKATKTYKQ
jgi:putative permease